jgi:RsmE family RNA methyltransferase
VIRLRLDVRQVIDGTARLTEPQRRYLRTVMRRGDGERVVVLLPEGPRWATLKAGDYLMLEGPAALAPVPRPFVTVALALLKGDHVAVALDAATQAGAGAFRLMVSRRSVVREATERRLQRWEAVVGEAAEQSGRADVPALHPPVPLATLPMDGPLVVLHPESPPLDTVYRALGAPDRLTLAVGPEGGFAADELALLEGRGAVRAGLGPRIVRAENAGAFAVFWLTQLAP